jgi:hypothetical protein
MLIIVRIVVGGHENGGGEKAATGGRISTI